MSIISLLAPCAFYPLYSPHIATRKRLKSYSCSDYEFDHRFDKHSLTASKQGRQQVIVYTVFPLNRSTSGIITQYIYGSLHGRTPITFASSSIDSPVIIADLIGWTTV